MTWYMVFRRDTGEPYSIGTEIADPMPPEFDAVPLSSVDADALMQGKAQWDSNSRSVVR